jgi:hypothetical protein
VRENPPFAAVVGMSAVCAVQIFNDIVELAMKEEFLTPPIDNEFSLSRMHVVDGRCAMPRTNKDMTRKKLQDALVAEVVENGIAAVSITRMVNRAKVSAGTVFVRFEDKDDMLRQVSAQSTELCVTSGFPLNRQNLRSASKPLPGQV